MLAKKRKKAHHPAGRLHGGGGAGGGAGLRQHQSGAAVVQRLGEISMQNQMRNAASRVIVVADSSKFGRASLVRICPIHAVEAIITDGGVDPEQAAAVENCGVRLILV